MRDIFVLTETQLRECVELDEPVVDVVESAFRALSCGDVIMPPIMSMEIAEANGEVDVKTAYIPGFEGFAIKVSTGFFDNPKLGLQSLNGLMTLFSARTGLVDALLLDNGYLTDIRTAAAGAVAVRQLALPQVDTVCVFGTGLQARLQVQAARLVRPFNRVLVWGRSSERAASCASDIEKSIGIEAVAVDHAEDAVARSQLVITTTPAREPIFKAEWLHPGLLVIAMGSDAEGKNEIEPEALRDADLYVCDRVSQCEKLGELRSARAAGYLAAVNPPELGTLISQADNRTARTDQSIICDLTGTGAQDTAIATHALKAAKSRGLGTSIPA